VRRRTSGAIGGHGRSLVLQPIVDVPTGIATGVEALARFDSPQTPDVWFAQAEPLGLRLALEIAAARSALTALHRPGHAGYLSLNLSAEAILSEEFPGLMTAADPTTLVVEITEHVVVEDYEALSRALRPYRDAGLRLAVDDAGAGYASLRHILKLHPDFIKIDLSLVRDIHIDGARQALVRSLVSFARTLDAVLVAEGVEQQAELDMLVRLGVRQMQGYLLCPPCADPPTSGFPVPSRHVRPDRRAIPA
jgi:EAL domain-containing protein (putative c-di-GMP-specific phosphodiesterase class I)